MTPEDSSLLREVDLRKMVLKAVMKDDNKKIFYKILSLMDFRGFCYHPNPGRRITIKLQYASY